MSQGFAVGGLTVRYYGLILGLAIVTGYLVARENAWRFGLGTDSVDRFAFWAIIVSFICARLYFVLFELDYFSNNPAGILRIWEGGVSIYGAIIGGFLFALLYSRGKAFSAWQLLDLAALSMPLAQAIGRFGNFVNYEAYGSETNLPWKMFVPETGAFHHPTFLYEAIANLSVFVILFRYRGRLKPGNLALLYVMAYALVRFLIEPLRVDSVFVSGFRADQVVSALVFLLAAGVFFSRKSRA